MPPKKTCFFCKKSKYKLFKLKNYPIIFQGLRKKFRNLNNEDVICETCFAKLKANLEKGKQNTMEISTNDNTSSTNLSIRSSDESEITRKRPSDDESSAGPSQLLNIAHSSTNDQQRSRRLDLSRVFSSDDEMSDIPDVQSDEPLSSLVHVRPIIPKRRSAPVTRAQDAMDRYIKGIYGG